MTPRELVHWAESKFEYAGLSYGHGTRNAREEAVYLVLGALDLPFDYGGARLDEPLDKNTLQRLRALLRKRIATRKPAAYLLRKAWFAGLEFYVDERVLVPRSPIAELIEQGFAPWVDGSRVRRILELCTGSGCIAVACALAFPEARVDATDISPEALAVAAINVERYAVGDRLRMIKSDLYRDVPRQRYDLIISNPPYVPAEDVAGLPREYQHEPALGLAAGDEGLAVVIRILHESAARLNEHGALIVEVGDRQEVLLARYPKVPFMWFEFERGGDGVFLLTAAQLREHFGGDRSS
ncbi:MAG TPA: 50S ribosomal protein L3 N(5)-glutamine methyltransferase [Gammaproteobacteria bacterium]|nr:50S ribosomal protein L3 N(5)-glutamine methyltransferase [Gammaproteobacteria bacterium]